MSNTRRQYKPRLEAKVISYLGRNGARDVLLTVTIPHGEKTRDVKVPLEVDLILKLADAIRCCPDHILETPRTGKQGPGPEAVPTNIGHAVWHIDNPEAPRPCLPWGGRIIDVGEAPARLGDGSPDDEPSP
jgi:hypothetical protein